MIYNIKVKKFFIPESRINRIIYVTLLSIAGAVILLLIIGSIFALARPIDSAPLFSFGRQTEIIISSTSQSDDIRVFSGLGRLRIPLADSSALILTIAFPYSASDVAFTEELAARIGDFRMIATDYFSSLPISAVIQIDEETAKQEILRRYNENLRLGRIDVLYFSDMMIIEAYYTP